MTIQNEIELIEAIGNELRDWACGLEYHDVANFIPHRETLKHIDVKVKKVFTWLQYHKPGLAQPVEELWQQILNDAWGIEGVPDREEYSTDIIIRATDNALNLSDKFAQIAKLAKENLSDNSTTDKKTRGKITGMSWQEARGQAETIVDHIGFPGSVILATLVGCDRKTLRKAIKNSTKLSDAQKKHKANRRSLPAAELSKKTLAKQEQTSEPDPSVSAEILDTDAVLQKLLNNTPAKDRAKAEASLKNLSREQQINLARVYQDDPDRVARWRQA